MSTSPDDNPAGGTREEFGESLERLRREHARRERLPPLSLREIADQTGCGSHTTVRNYLTGRTLPSSEALERILRLFGAGQAQGKLLADERDRLEYDVEREAPPPDPAGVAPSRPARRRTFIAVAAVATTATAVAAGLFLTSGDAPDRRTTPFVQLTVSPPVEEPVTDPGCHPEKEWNHRFDGTYRGDVYAQLSGGTRAALTTNVELLWGTLHWRGRVEIRPGTVSQGQGGTLLGFGKDHTTTDTPPDPNWPVTLRSESPVCVAFGTALNHPSPSLYLRTPGWEEIAQ